MKLHYCILKATRHTDDLHWCNEKLMLTQHNTTQHTIQNRCYTTCNRKIQTRNFHPIGTSIQPHRILPTSMQVQRELCQIYDVKFFLSCTGETINCELHASFVAVSNSNRAQLLPIAYFLCLVVVHLTWQCK